MKLKSLVKKAQENTFDTYYYKGGETYKGDWMDAPHLKDKSYILHREDGPASISRSEEGWYKDGKKHRLNGPALIKKYPGKPYKEEFWIEGERVEDPIESGVDLFDTYKEMKKHRDLVNNIPKEESIQKENIRLNEDVKIIKFPYKVEVADKNVGRKANQPVILLVPNQQTKDLMGDELYKYYSLISTHREKNEICHARLDIYEEENVWVIAEIQYFSLDF